MQTTRFFLFIALFSLAATGIHAGTVTTDVSTLDEGRCRSIDWPVAATVLPVAVCRRTQAQLTQLRRETTRWAEPDLLRSINAFAYDVADSELASQVFAMQLALQHSPSRSQREEYLVVIQTDPHIGCQLITNYDEAERPFYNPCHENIFDGNGRVLKQRSKQIETHPLRIPPHHYKGSTLVIGEMGADSKWVQYDFRPDFRDSLRSEPHRLILAARWGALEELKRLLAGGLDVDSSSEQQGGATALMAAVAMKQFDAVRLLLKRGANPNVMSVHGSTPLQIANLIQDQRMVALLKSFGATNAGKALE